MASVTLPTAPGYASFRPFLVDAGGVQRGALGGVGQRVNRLGSRFGIEITLPPLESGQAAMNWVGALNVGLREGVIAQWPQLGFSTGSPGSVLVNGAGQAGFTLNVDGGTAGYIARSGQFLNFTAGGRKMLHHLRSDLALNGSGAGALPIFPDIRVSPADNSAVSFTDPVIEGWLEGDDRSWSVDQARTVGLSFTVIEK
jgi:hypothetical protein